VDCIIDTTGLPELTPRRHAPVLNILSLTGSQLAGTSNQSTPPPDFPLNSGFDLRCSQAEPTLSPQGLNFGEAQGQPLPLCPSNELTAEVGTSLHFSDLRGLSRHKD
jgi:hypothetical protein